ncbi:PREDICTED: telethonin-like [Poecilia mexicana]|uniref:Telethonin-like n=2 Tax=Poecilia TaxID=8080 RepID=A0A087YM00_POEFO|nr:PREDICTED: telethonin-like [Poecilia formosa]XP_014860654.1 PREDICTED: telethonin-like [Poecilia mexicana]
MHCVSRGGVCLVKSYSDLQEDDLCKKESYSACWLNVVLETRPEYRITLSETDSVRRESYKQQQVVHLMVKRSPSQTLKLGIEGGVLREYQLPFSSRSKAPQRASGTEQPVIEGKANLTADREEAPATAGDLCKPVRENFRASRLMSSPREVSDRKQRRE